MSVKIVIGVDGSGSGERAVAHAKNLAKLIGDCELLVVYVIEWSPFTFQTPEENEQRHKRREEEIAAATSRVVDPVVQSLIADGVKARGIVKHGHVADLLNSTAVKEGANQIVVARTSDAGIASRIFGTSTGNLVMSAKVPVTVVV